MERLIVVIKNIKTKKERLVSFIGKNTNIDFSNINQAFPGMKDLHKYVVTVFKYNDTFHKKLQRDSNIINQYSHSGEKIGKIIGINDEGKYLLEIDRYD